MSLDGTTLSFGPNHANDRSGSQSTRMPHNNRINRTAASALTVPSGDWPSAAGYAKRYAGAAGRRV
jgi:hypothetical protein